MKDQLRLVSVSKGQDLKYVLLRLQKAVARIEEALKVRKFNKLNLFSVFIVFACRVPPANIIKCPKLK